MAKSNINNNNSTAASAKHKRDKDDVGGISFVDLLRVLVGLLVISSGLSYVITGDSISWGYRLWFLNFGQVQQLWKGPLQLTEEQLLKYDGTDPSLPVYLALNGTIYDVSAGRSTYGPGGSYHFFAGRDAARAFLTGCFQEDLTGDLRGVEEMFVPVDPPEDGEEGSKSQAQSYDPQKGRPTPANPSDKTEKKKAGKRKPLTKGQEKIRREQEYRQARKKVHDGIEGWAKLFRGDKGKPYFEVGKVKRDPDWPEKLPKRKLCEAAEKSRPERKYD